MSLFSSIPLPPPPPAASPHSSVTKAFGTVSLGVLDSYGPPQMIASCRDKAESWVSMSSPCFMDIFVSFSFSLPFHHFLFASYLPISSSTCPSLPAATHLSPGAALASRSCGILVRFSITPIFDFLHFSLISFLFLRVICSST